MATSPYLQPFVLPVGQARRQRDGNLDAYWPDASSSHGVVGVIFGHRLHTIADIPPRQTTPPPP